MSLLQRKDVRGNGAGGAGAQRAVGERSAGAAGGAAPSAPADPELVERPRRRSFTAEYKLAILREADGLSRPGEIGALLRREGLYSSHLSTWRGQREEGAFEALSRPRGRKPEGPLAVENAELQRRLTRSETELEKARRVIAVQGNVCALLGELFEPRGASETASTDCEHRLMIEGAVEELSPIVGTRPACRALGAAPATIYRRRRPPRPKAPQPRPASARALSSGERELVLAELRSARFVDASPAAVWATLLGRGPLPLLAAHHVPAPRGARRAAGAPRPARTPGLCTPRASGRATERGLELGHHQAQGPGHLDLLLPLRHPRRLQPLRGGLDGAAPRIRRARQGPHRPDGRAAEDRPGHPDRARLPRQLDDLQTGGLPARRPRRDQDA